MKTIDEFPTKLDDIISFSCNIDSLISIIQFLHRNNTTMNQSIKDLTRRIKSIEALNEDLEQVTLKTQAHERKFNEVEESLANHSNKLLEFDAKMTEIVKANESSNATIANYNKVIDAHEENINNLNRVVEDNIKSSKAQEEKIGAIDTKLNETAVKLDKTQYDMKNNKELEAKMNQSLSNLSIEVNELRDSFELKVIDIDKTVSNLISSLNRSGSGGNEGGEGTTNFNQINPRRSITQPNLIGGTSASDYLINSALDDIEKLNRKSEEATRNYNEIKKLVKGFDESNEEERNVMNAKIDRLNDIITNNQLLPNGQLLLNPNANNEDNDSIKKQQLNMLLNAASSLSSANLDENQKQLLDLYKTLSENISIIGGSLGEKVNRDELTTMNLITLSKIETVSDKLNENLILIDNRLKKISGGGSMGGGLGSDGSNQISDLDLLYQSIEKQMIDNIHKISTENIKKQVLDNDISSNPTLNRIIVHMNKLTDELNEAYKSIVDIRSTLVTKDILEDIGDMKMRLDLSEEDYRRLKFKFDEFKSSLEDDEQQMDSRPNVSSNSNANANNNHQALPRQSTLSTNVKTSINSLTVAYKDLYDKVMAIEKKNKEMTTEIRESIKNSLKSETERVIEQFQKNLTSFTNKFEYQLKNKIDQIGLSSFEYKMNNRLTSEMKNKLDQKDMKKNNHVINRKFDSLENKISKTLVDTIIDLQMDEAPLIVKKNNRNVEKCASCNQSLPQMTYMLTSTNANENSGNGGVFSNRMMNSKSNWKDKDKDKETKDKETKEKEDKDKLPNIE